MIFESHAHYDDEAYEEDRAELLAKMSKEQIGYIINVGASMESSRNTLALTKEYDFVYGALGVHPSETGELDEEKFQWLEDTCLKEHIHQGGKIVAVGEIGLDYNWPEPTRDIQKKWFCRQLELAKKVQLPIIIHSRDAAQDTLELMQAQKAEELTGIIHCYSYSKEMAREYLNMNYYFGIGGVVTFKNAKTVKEAVAYIPIEKIVLETDSPYLAPEPNRGQRNSSLNIPYIAQAIAEIKGLTYEQVVTITYNNAKQIFDIA